MAFWSPWRGCKKYSEGCKFCYIHKGDAKKGIETGLIVKSENFDAPKVKMKNGEYKMKSGQTVYVCFQTDFLLEEADKWRDECWKIMKERSDLHFIFLTKRIERFLDCVPDDWGDGYPNVEIGVSIENQENADYRLDIFSRLPIIYKDIICQPLLEKVTILEYLDNINLVVAGGESDINARFLDYDWVLKIREECVSKNINLILDNVEHILLKMESNTQSPIKIKQELPENAI